MTLAAEAGTPPRRYGGVLGDPYKIWDVYAVGQGHREVAAGQLVDEERARARVIKWSEIRRRKRVPGDRRHAADRRTFGRDATSRQREP